jgi:hypothetical protein
MGGFRRFATGAFVICVSASSLPAAEKIPTCRLDNEYKDDVAGTLELAASTYKAIGYPMPFQSVFVNPEAQPREDGSLAVFIVSDAAVEGVSPDGCAVIAVDTAEPLDELSVKGGCVVMAVDRMEIRCSAGAVRIFADHGLREDKANPALLYVLSHELAHIHQRRAGEYAGRSISFSLARTQSTKLEELRSWCDPLSIKRETDADEMAYLVLARLVNQKPYREPLFSERGSVLWNVDQLALASDAWQRTALEREFISQPELHSAFNPIEFPTPQAVINANARRFVCDALTKNKGVILYAAKSPSHPPIEQRLLRIAETLGSVAAALPETGAPKDYEPISRLQQDLSPIFSYIYRETGVYMEKLDNSICTIINSEAPLDVCR